MTADATIHVLLVEDDHRLARLTEEYLVSHGLVVTVAADGEVGLAAALRHRFDVVLLDVMLPARPGTEVLKALRAQSDVPVIMLTARGEEADRVLGLELGADDYVAKPFSAREVLARIQAQVRRRRNQVGPATRVLSRGDLVLDPARREATLAGRALDLTGYEFALLYALVERAGRIVGREEMMELARGSAEEAFDRSIDVHVSRLRKKLGDDPRRPQRIKTVRGAGYQYLDEEKR